MGEVCGGLREVVAVELAIDANLVQLRKGGEAVFVGDFGFALDQRSGVAHELEVHGNAVFIDPVSGQLFHSVGDVSERREAGFAAVGIAFTAEQGDHLVGLTGDGRFDGGLSGEEGFVGVSSGAIGNGGTLSNAEFGGAGFNAGEIGFDEALQVFGGATELSVTERVGGFSGGDIVAIGVHEAFADHDVAELLALERALHVGDELLRGEGHLGEENDVGRIVRVVAAFGERGASSDPAGVAAHDFENGNEVTLAS